MSILILVAEYYLLGYITSFCFSFHVQSQLTNICSKSTIEALKKKFEMYSKLAIRISKRIVVPVSVLFNLNINIFFECFFHYLLWKCKYLVGNISLNLKRELQSLRKPIYHSFKVTSPYFLGKSILQVEEAPKAASI